MTIHRRAASLLLSLLLIIPVWLGGTSPARAVDAGAYPECTGESTDGPCQALDNGQPLPNGYIAYTFPNDLTSFAAVADVASKAQGRKGSYGILNEGTAIERFYEIFQPTGTADSSVFPSYPACPDGAAPSMTPPCQVLDAGRSLPNGSVVFTFPHSTSSFAALADVASHSQARQGTYSEIGDRGGPWHRFVAAFAPKPAEQCCDEPCAPDGNNGSNGSNGSNSGNGNNGNNGKNGQSESGASGQGC